MDSQTVMMSLVAGALIYVVIELDKRYLSTKEETKSMSSLRIATLMSLVVYGVISYFKCSVTCSKSPLLGIKTPSTSNASSINRQQILTEPFQ